MKMKINNIILIIIRIIFESEKLNIQQSVHYYLSFKMKNYFCEGTKKFTNIITIYNGMLYNLFKYIDTDT